MEITAENKVNQTAETSSENVENTGELNRRMWSVVSFESVAVRNLTYQEAQVWVEKLQKQKLSGLCIITDESATRVSE